MGKIYDVVKRILDMLFALVLFIALFPFFLIIILLIRRDSPGPAIFIQKRIGHNQKEFDMYKFRTMRIGAEKELKSLMHLNEAHFPAFKMKNDPRLTVFGKKLRKFGLDELPQLLNILKGEMSFVGFRPPLPEEVKNYKKWHMKRFDGIPGILSSWAVGAGHELSFDEWIKLDLTYNKDKSFATDYFIVSSYLLIIVGKIISKLVRSIMLVFARIFAISFKVFIFIFKKILSVFGILIGLFGTLIGFIFKQFGVLKRIFLHLTKYDSRCQSKKTIMFYFFQGKGFGHVSRIVKLSKLISENYPGYRVVILGDTRYSDKFPETCEVIKLPEVPSEFLSGILTDEQEFQSKQMISLRKKLIYDTIREIRPGYFFVDFFPKGKYSELEQSLKFLRNKSKSYLIMRDILDSKSNTDIMFVNKGMSKFIRKHYQKLLIFGDRDVFDLKKEYNFDFFQDKMIYLGYLMEEGYKKVISGKKILITLGSGFSGYNILENLLNSLGNDHNIRVILGPKMSSRANELVKRFNKVEFKHYVEDLSKEISESSAVISMAGYNSTTELLAYDVPVLLIPYADKGWQEQLMRAKVFKEDNLMNYILPEDICKKNLVRAISQARSIAKKRKKALDSINTDGKNNFIRFMHTL